MDFDEPELVLVADAPEGADQVARLDRPSGPGSEHEPAFWPGGAHDGAVGGLLVGLELECLAGEIEQRQSSPSSVGLDRPEDELAADALQLAANVDGPGVEVDIVPAQSECFATAQAVEDEQDERWVQRIVPGDGQEPACLDSGPGANRAAMPFRKFGQAGDVAHDEFFADSTGERSAEHGPHDVYLANRVTLLQPLIQELLDDRHGQAGEPSAAQARDQVETAGHLVQGVGGRAPVALDEVLQPVLQVQPQLPRFVRNRN